MGLAMNLSKRFKAWVQCRPKVDIDESATWFLFLFLYAHGLAMDRLGLKFSGIFPVLSVPQMSLVMTFLCLVISVLILVEPLLPCKLRKRIQCARYSYFGQYIRHLSMLFAFILGLTSVLNLLSEKLSTFSWLTNSVAWVGIVILFVMLIRVTLFSCIWRKRH